VCRVPGSPAESRGVVPLVELLSRQELKCTAVMRASPFLLDASGNAPAGSGDQRQREDDDKPCPASATASGVNGSTVVGMVSTTAA
jgi:hypothetical protein